MTIIVFSLLEVRKNNHIWISTLLHPVKNLLSIWTEKSPLKKINTLGNLAGGTEGPDCTSRDFRVCTLCVRHNGWNLPTKPSERESNLIFPAILHWSHTLSQAPVQCVLTLCLQISHSSYYSFLIWIFRQFFFVLSLFTNRKLTSSILPGEWTSELQGMSLLYLEKWWKS